ncbi:hypothetical protein EVAR_17069_1 [Eumeta japonica]|uniref:Uncharacterized protein n=1 Tax=Eumeta variegata TaxID=151549 RepID=A0A4C1V4M8_EUMVA|nr:hypothetical protein EVAR_17069_1 [Eumeta japonica]
MFALYGKGSMLAEGAKSLEIKRVEGEERTGEGAGKRESLKSKIKYIPGPAVSFASRKLSVYAPPAERNNIALAVTCARTKRIRLQPGPSSGSRPAPALSSYGPHVNARPRSRASPARNRFGAVRSAVPSSLSRRRSAPTDPMTFKSNVRTLVVRPKRCSLASFPFHRSISDHGSVVPVAVLMPLLVLFGHGCDTSRNCVTLRSRYALTMRASERHASLPLGHG